MSMINTFSLICREANWFYNCCITHENGMWLPQWFDETNGHLRKNLTQNGELQAEI